MNFKKYISIAVTVAFACLILFFAVISFRYHSWSADPRPAQKLTEYFARITKSDFQYRSLEWRLLPFPSVRFSEPVFTFKSELKHELKARSLELHLDLVKLLFGEFGFSGLHLIEGDWRGQIDAPKGIHNFLVHHIDLKTSAILSNRPVKIYMSGDTGGRRKAVVIHGTLKLPPLEEPRLDSLGFEVQVLTRNFRFEDSPEWEFLGWIPSSGISDFLIELKHAPLSDRIDFSGDAGLHDLLFRSADQPAEATYKVGNLQVKFGGYFSPATDELKLVQCAASLPFAEFNLQGAYLPHRREFRSMTFSFMNVKLDDLPKYFPDFKNQIPSFIDFAGLTDISFSLNGFAKRLKIYGDFDLTRTLFTYGRFFQKQKDKEFHLKADLDWAEELLAGEFSGNFENLTFKGNLPEWRPSGALKINFITNAFAAEQMAEFVPFLSSYELGGSMKLFAGFEGKLEGIEPFQKMFHLNMEGGRILRKGTGSGFKDLNLDLDFGPLLMEVKAPQFSVGGSFFSGDLKGMHPESNPKWQGRLTSEKLIPANVWKEWKDFWGGENAAWLESLHPWVRRLILSERPFESLKVNFSSQGMNSQIDSLELKAFDGNLSGSVNAQLGEADQKIQMEMQGRDMDSAQLFQFLGTTEPGLEGRVDWKTSLESTLTSGLSRSWSGPVSVFVQNGFLNHFDYVQALKEVEVLKSASTAGASDRLAFKSIKLNGKIQDDRLKVQELKLMSENTQIDGEGEMNGEGILDFSLKTRLDAEYFRELFPKRANDFISGQDTHFGPVTLLAFGPLDGLTLKLDPKSATELVGRFTKKKTEVISRYL